MWPVPGYATPLAGVGNFLIRSEAMCDEVGMESELPVEAYIACIAEMDTTITHILEANAMQRQIQW